MTRPFSLFNSQQGNSYKTPFFSGNMYSSGTGQGGGDFGSRYGSYTSSANKGTFEENRKTMTRDQIGYGMLELVDITAMNSYKYKCVDEIRAEDYVIKNIVHKNKAVVNSQSGQSYNVRGLGSQFKPPFGDSTSVAGKSLFEQPLQTRFQPKQISSVNAPTTFFNRPSDTSFNNANFSFAQSSSLNTQPSSFNTVPQPTTSFNTAQPSSFNSMPSTSTTVAQPSSFNRIQTNPLNFTKPSSFTTQPSSFNAVPQPSSFNSMPPASTAVAQSTFNTMQQNDTANLNYKTMVNNLDDPYCIEGLTFEHIERLVAKPKKEYYKTIFSTNDYDNRPTIRMQNKVDDKPYSIPKYEDVMDHVRVKNPTFVFPGKGKIELKEAMETYLLRQENIEKYVFSDRDVNNVYGKRARVYIENVRPQAEENIERFIYEIKKC